MREAINLLVTPFCDLLFNFCSIYAFHYIYCKFACLYEKTHGICFCWALDFIFWKYMLLCISDWSYIHIHLCLSVSIFCLFNFHLQWQMAVSYSINAWQNACRQPSPEYVITANLINKKVRKSACVCVRVVL